MLPTLKKNAATGYQGPVKRELLKGAGLPQKSSRGLSGKAEIFVQLITPEYKTLL